MVLALSAGSMFAQWSPAGDRIKTEWAEQIDPANVLPEYPRPQMERADWQNLNGLWQYAVIPKDAALPGEPFEKPEKGGGIMKRICLTGVSLLFAFVLLSGCGGREEELTVRCACGEDYYTLPLEQKGTSDGGSNGISFEIDMSLSQLKTLIDGTDTGSARLKTETVGELLAIFKTDGTGRLHYYCILQSGSTFFLSNAENFGIAVPFHLFAEEEQEAWQYGLYLNNGEYATEYGISEFSDFYEGLEEVKMSAEGDTLSVEPQTAPKGGTASCRIVFTFSEGSVLASIEALS